MGSQYIPMIHKNKSAILRQAADKVSWQATTDAFPSHRFLPTTDELSSSKLESMSAR